MIQSLTNFYTKPRVYMRVLVSIPLAFFLSHVLLFDKQETGTLAVLLVKQIGGIYIVSLLIGWVLLAGEHNLKTYIRITISVWWAVLFHLIIFYNASGGLLFFQVSAFVAFTAGLTYAITGLQTNEFIKAIEETKEARRVRYNTTQLSGSDGQPKQQLMN